MRRTSLWRVVVWSLAVVAAAGAAGAAGACSDSAAPTLPPCTSSRGLPVALAVAQYVAVDPVRDSGCVVFPGNASATAPVEYLLVPQAATGTPGASTNFALRGDTLKPLAGGGAIGLEAAVTAFPQGRSPAEQFHSFLRRAEESRWALFPPAPGTPGPRPELAPAGPPVVGSQRQFSVCSNLTCSQFKKIPATVKTVGRHLAIYVDSAAPAAGLNQADIDTLATLFDTRLYGVDSAAFGTESDVDGNTVVIVLMTPVVNSLVPRSQCDTAGFVAGFFFGADIDPLFANDSRFNHAEIFYSLVADPDSTLSCAHSRDQVKKLVPITFVHEFQHMISYNQHVLVRKSNGEALWLNEALSHFAEELGGRSFLPGDNASFSRYVSGDLYNAYQYLNNTGKYFVLPTEGIGTLAERGAGWLFLRYLVDQYGDSLTRRLVQTTLTGAANVASQTGAPFTQLVTRWTLANWVSDLDSVVAGFPPPAELQYKSWKFRTTFASLNAQRPSIFVLPFPLVPTAGAGNLVNLTGVLRAGSGVYHRVMQAPGAPGFTLLFSAGGITPLPGSIVARLNVVRIR